jgi:hypothetical protein
MIHYDLICDKGHEFDGWFADSAAYDKLARRKLVECTHCGSAKIEKQIMAPGIPSKSNRKADSNSGQLRVATPPVDPRAQQMMAMMREFRQHVEKNAENMGDRFAEEARKIHYKEAEARGIMGSASPDEAKSLIEEGISVMPLPRLPEDAN